MARRPWLTIAVVLIAAVLSLSCITPCFSGLTASSQRGDQATPQPTVPTSDDAASRFQEKAQALERERFTVEFTDEEVTSYLALQAHGTLPITAPQVSFHPGRVVVTGDLTSPIRGHVTLGGVVRVTGGSLQLEFDDASIGGITIPRAALTSLSDTVSQLIIDAQSPVQIDSVEVLEGLIRITGHRAP